MYGQKYLITDLLYKVRAIIPNKLRQRHIKFIDYHLVDDYTTIYEKDTDISIAVFQKVFYSPVPYTKVLQFFL